MKKLWILMMAALMLSACGTEQTFETVSDEMVLQVSAQPREIHLTLPEDTLLPAMESDSGTLYFCSGYDVTVQTLSGGDPDATIRQITGFGKDELTVIETLAGEYSCYDFVWTAATDFGEQLCRGMILDDGAYHYVVTAATAANKAEEYLEIWNGMFETVYLS